jgi:ribose transport system substrate-binding protein
MSSSLNPRTSASARSLPVRTIRWIAVVGFALALPTFAVAAPKIGVLLKGRTPFWASMEKGALDAGAKLGVEVVVKSAPTEGDVGVQVQLLNAMAAQGFDALVIVPANQDALAAPVAAIAAKGTKIVVLESPLSSKSSPVFVGTDHGKAGEAAGQLVASLVADADEVSFLNSSQTNSATTAREKAAMSKLRELRSKCTVHADIYASAEVGTEADKARLLLTRYPSTKAVFSSGTGGTLAMLKVLQEEKRAGTVKLVGFGFNLNSEVATAISEGKMQGWVAWQPRELGRQGVQAALALIKGESVPAVVNTDFVVVTPDNLHDAKVQALMGQ